MRTYTNKRSYRDLNMPNTTTTCFKTPFNSIETKQQPAAKVRQITQPSITITHKPTFFEKVKKFVKRFLRTK
jgi:predicted MPP superfamily phosphohydrolase